MPQRTLLEQATAKCLDDVPPAFSCRPVGVGLGATWLRASGGLDLAATPRLVALTGSLDDIDVLNMDPDEQLNEMFEHRSRRRFLSR